ncbi:restriction endonuclease [Nocardia huaxiensis]|uniref:Restriction endonuclease n=1 Tax=Nocardia huaxiensis TaxID=2755382 RepID=A0A7D6VHZ7_9NOCA|nr:restriction endonuclease [Nocardia huaxiensis]QLY30416.1 restriction endonuclease [Nocardia huaxiensis]
MQLSSHHKRISAQAYQALRNALPVVFWYKERTLQPFLKAAFREDPSVLRGLDFKGETKWVIVGKLVDRLLEQEASYQKATIHLMLEVANMTRFVDLEQLEDADVKIAKARAAVAELKRHTEVFELLLTEKQRVAAQQAVLKQQIESQQKFEQTLRTMHSHFIHMHGDPNPQARGKAFEGFLNHLFGLFDLNPRTEYILDREQIDGAFTLEGNDYIVEAKWRKDKLTREQADAFAAKVHRKATSSFGLIISVMGFTKDAVDEYRSRTPFITMDGADLTCVLEGRIRLDELLIRKKRHANDTGQCYFPVSEMF